MDTPRLWVEFVRLHALLRRAVALLEEEDAEPEEEQSAAWRVDFAETALLTERTARAVRNGDGDGGVPLPLGQKALLLNALRCLLEATSDGHEARRALQEECREWLKAILTELRMSAGQEGDGRNKRVFSTWGGVPNAAETVDALVAVLRASKSLSGENQLGSGCRTPSAGGTRREGGASDAERTCLRLARLLGVSSALLERQLRTAEAAETLPLGALAPKEGP